VASSVGGPPWTCTKQHRGWNPGPVPTPGVEHERWRGIRTRLSDPRGDRLRVKAPPPLPAPSSRQAGESSGGYCSVTGFWLKLRPSGKGEDRGRVGRCTGTPVSTPERSARSSCRSGTRSCTGVFG
jgi:hypothetical protein